MLPAEVRCTAVGARLQPWASASSGGSAPLIATYLVARTSDDFTPAYYVMAMAVVSFVALLGLPETAGKRLA